MYSLPQSYNQTSKCKRCISSNAYGYSGIDPEVNADPNKSTTAANTGNYPLLGMDYGTYPRARTFTFGVNITF